MNERIIRLPQVREMVGLGTTAIYGKIKAGAFPRQIKIGRASGWLESEIQDWISQQITHNRMGSSANPRDQYQAL
ncbi:AlpA family transcriptional regulator [Laribacter hongkongensis]|uniref:helix-turn-helix transcriptional regulator n=1 Tax=Laribacter hongkongensis TaxID=168471 RepID=UPI001EFD711E|nr:AlpA family transcriptional regulator [Laribacter hongkongensis]MCG9054755.1 AlpA family transcriptional regulator [Laribacter hongkongensis]MCG9064685.1 AlpA family transcriptional regulator [Laribacter hongkongensis]